MINIKIKGGHDVRKMEINAAREARVKLNQISIKEQKIDYLTNLREDR